MRRSKRMACGLCSRARARPSCGTPVSMTSKMSLSSRRIRRRMASSSSTTNSLSIVTLLLSPLADAGSGQFGHRGCGGHRGLPPIEHLTHLADENLFDKRFVQEMDAGIQNSVAGDEAVRITGHVEHLNAGLAQQ